MRPLARRISRSACWRSSRSRAGSCTSRSLALPEGSAPVLSLLGAGPLIVPYGARAGGFRVGGLSALARAADGTWLALVDDDGETPARVFRLAFEVSGERGVPLPAGKTPLQMPLAAIPLAGFTGKTLDGEGLALEPAGEMLIASEIEPSIREFSPAGKLLRALPVPELFLATDKRGVRGNLGFESLTLSPGGEALWTANERALRQDAPEDAARASPVRLLRYGRRGGGFVPGGAVRLRGGADREARPAASRSAASRICWPCRTATCWPWSGSSSRGAASASRSSGSPSPAPPTCGYGVAGGDRATRRSARPWSTTSPARASCRTTSRG